MLNMLNKGTINDCVRYVIQNEGGYSNHRSDYGGETYWGITKAFAQENGVPWPPSRRDAEQAYEAIGKKFGVFYLDGPTAKFLLDGCVLFGFRRFIGWFQGAINACCGSSLVVDGVIGPKTVAAYSACNKRVVIRRLHEHVRSYHIAVVSRDRSQLAFLRGWLVRAESRYNEFLKGLENG